MESVNNILNRIDTLNDQNIGTFKKVVQSRATNLFITTPTELSQVVLNTFTVPFHLVGAIAKTATKAVAFITGSQAIKNLEAKLPGFCDLLRTIKNVFANAIGAFLSATIGVLFPRINFKMHCALGLAIDQRQEAINAALAKKQIEEAQMTIDLEDNDELTAEELELLNNLTLAFAMAKQLEFRAKEIAENAAKTAENTFISIENTVSHSAHQLEEAESCCSLDNQTCVVDAVEQDESILGQTLNSIYESGKSILSSTYNAITSN